MATVNGKEECETLQETGSDYGEVKWLQQQLPNEVILFFFKY